jgi:hypothetical protein
MHSLCIQSSPLSVSSRGPPPGYSYPALPPKDTLCVGRLPKPPGPLDGRPVALYWDLDNLRPSRASDATSWAHGARQMRVALRSKGATPAWLPVQGLCVLFTAQYRTAISVPFFLAATGSSLHALWASGRVSGLCKPCNATMGARPA